MAKRKSTSVELVAVLEARNTNGKYNALIERAKENGYHDFKFDLKPKYAECACPKVELFNELAKHSELSDVALDVRNGVYDESPDEDDAKRMRDELRADGAPESLIKQIGVHEDQFEEREKRRNEEK